MIKGLLESRPIVDADLHALMEIYNNAVRHSGYEHGSGIVDIEGFKQCFFQTPWTHGVVVQQEEQLLGWGFIRRFAPWGASLYTFEMCLWVDFPFRSQGVGRRLYEELEQAAMAHQTHLLMIVVDASKAALQQVLKRRGFEAKATLNRVMQSPSGVKDLLIFQKHFRRGNDS